MSWTELPPLEEADITAQEILPHRLWRVRVGQTIYGPFATAALREHGMAHPDDMLGAFASTVAEEDWRPILETSPFKVRQPSLVSATTLAPPHQFYVLLRGERKGPHTLEEVREMARKKELLVSDLVSTDEGETWRRLSEVKYFEQRQLARESLPASPAPSLFVASTTDDDEVFEEDPIQLGITGLAHLCHRQELPLKLEELGTTVESSWANLFSYISFKWVAASGMVCSAVLAFLMWPTAPAPYLAEAEPEYAAAESVQEAPASSSVLRPAPARHQNARQPAARPARRPAAYHPPVASPPAMVDRPVIEERWESHDDAREPASEPPAQADPYPDENPVMENSLTRRPNAVTEEGYPMEDQVPQEVPIIEESGDLPQ